MNHIFSLLQENFNYYKPIVLNFINISVANKKNEVSTIQQYNPFSLFQENFNYYKPLILYFINIIDVNYINNNFELITIDKKYLCLRLYADTYHSFDEMKEIIIKTYIEKLDDNIYLCINNYPYIGPNNLKSYVIWFLDNKNYKNEYIELLLLKKNIINKKKNDYMIFQNPNDLKSMKSIKHCHLIIRNHNNIIPSLINIKIKKLIILVRNGPYTPIPEYQHHVPIINSTLLEINKLYCRLAGDELMNGYKNNIHFEELQEKNIYIGSSNFKKTIFTTKNYLLGIGLNTNFKIHILEELKISDKNVDMLQQIENQLILNLDKNFIDNFNIEIKRIFDVDNDSYVYLYNIINMCKLYKISLPNEWTPVLNLHLKDIIVDYYNNLFEYKTSSLLINKLLDKIILLLYDKQIKFGFLCSDDAIIMALIKCIQPNTIFNIPDFCSVIRFELWENNLLRIYYDGLIIKEVILF